MNENAYQWVSQSILDQDGVIVGCSQNHEWMLPWWWMNYCMQNEFPVTFVNFGNMSAAAQQWCRRKGNLVTIDVEIEKFVVPKEKVPPEQANIWKGQELDTWTARLQWFKKPFACLQSPYRRTIWIDVDCQVRKNIKPIFDYCENSLQISLAEEPPLVQKFHEQKGLIQFGEVEYNTGVIAFKHGNSTIQEWAKMCIKHNNTLRGDQEVLSRLVFLNDLKIHPLDPKHNWRGEFDISSDTLIIHWLGASKHHIKEEMQTLSASHWIDFSL